MPKTIRPAVLPAGRRAATLVQSHPTLGMPHPKGYRAKVGNKRFWLGRDAEQALELLRLITAEWAAINHQADAAHGRSAVAAWTADSIDRIEDAKARHKEARDAAWQPVRALAIAPALPTAAPAAVAEPVVAAANGGSTMLLSEAIKAHLDLRRLDVQAGQIQPSRMAQIRYSLARLHWAVEDQPINQIGPDQIRRIVQFFLARPVSPSRGRPIRGITAAETLYHTKKLFQDLQDRGEWTTPKPLERLFKYRRDNLLTDAEREAASKVTVFTLAELRTLWQVAGRRLAQSALHRSRLKRRLHANRDRHAPPRPPSPGRPQAVHPAFPPQDQSPRQMALVARDGHAAPPPHV